MIPKDFTLPETKYTGEERRGSTMSQIPQQQVSSYERELGMLISSVNAMKETMNNGFTDLKNEINLSNIRHGENNAGLKLLIAENWDALDKRCRTIEDSADRLLTRVNTIENQHTSEQQTLLLKEKEKDKSLSNHAIKAAVAGGATLITAGGLGIIGKLLGVV